MREWFSWSSGDGRIYVLARDVVFMKAIVNTFICVPVAAPLQDVLALLINQRLRGINVFRAIQFMPVAVSIVVVPLLRSFICDQKEGILNSLQSTLSFGAMPRLAWLGS